MICMNKNIFSLFFFYIFFPETFLILFVFSCCLAVSFLLSVFFEIPIVALEKRMLADVTKMLSSCNRKKDGQ